MKNLLVAALVLVGVAASAAAESCKLSDGKKYDLTAQDFARLPVGISKQTWPTLDETTKVSVCDSRYVVSKLPDSLTWQDLNTYTSASVSYMSSVKPSKNNSEAYQFILAQATLQSSNWAFNFLPKPRS